MMNRLGYFLSTIIVFSFSSCSVLESTAKQELSDGFYIKKSQSQKSIVYVDVVDEQIHIHSTNKQGNKIKIDSIQSCEVYFSELKSKEKIDFTLSQNSFDVDFITIPLKFRLGQKEVPAQLNANLNGALYLGYRTDRYTINYQQNPLKMAFRKTNHFGYSMGFFTGFGNTLMSPTNTNNQLQQEYDGIVWSKGIAGIVGINNFTVGISFGFDHLLDQNKNIWIYEGKPWLGLAFGLNLN
ncbi:MAG: hypothetical protein JSS94_06750 [Bacteroidetes bacterium]|nr:hypothetical protein [Bacteroidota bacterium]